MGFLKLLQEKGEANKVVDVGGELLTLTNNIITSMTMRKTFGSENDISDVNEIRKMVIDTSKFVGKFNVSDFIWFCKNFDFYGMNKRLKIIRDKFDRMMERVIKEHQQEKKKMDEGGGDHVRDLLDILLEIQEDQTNEIKLTSENVKAIILVSQLSSIVY